MFLQCQLSLVSVTLCLCLAEKVRYDGYQVLRVTPKTYHQMHILGNLTVAYLDSSKYVEQLNFWTEPSSVNKPVDIMVSPSLRKILLRKLKKGGIYFEVMIKDIQELIDEEQKSLNQSVFDYNSYNSYEMIQQWITETAAKYEYASEGSIGLSYEGRNIGYLKISTGGEKKAVVIDGAIHANEWIAPATVLYLAKYLIEGGGDAQELLEKFDFYIIPVLNVDGYSYTWTKRRLWRKTRKPNKGSMCKGTDPNRNFAVGWGGKGSRGFPCSQTYRGSKPFSEPEIAALRDFMTTLVNSNGVAMYINYHSFGQLWMTPNGYKEQLPADYDVQYNGAELACNALKEVHGTVYQYGNVYDTIYPASGVSVDFMYEDLGVTFSYTPECRDTGRYGFLLPKRFIQPSGEENWAAFKTLCKYVYDQQ